jgi:hypothetical protein
VINVGSKRWTKEEIAYLSDNWGLVSKNTIANNLNRSLYSIEVKKNRLKLGAFLESGEYVTLNQLFIALGRGSAHTYSTISWIKNRNLPVKSKTVGKCKFRVVYLEDCWKWAEKNRSFIDFSKVEENILGKEPKWVKEQRKADLLKKSKIIATPWTKKEDTYLHNLLKMFKYSYSDLSKRLHRSEGAIQRRICDLGLKERPLRESSHSIWEEWQLEKLKECINKGYGYELMSDIIGKSVKAIRGKTYVLYGSENLDKVRTLAVKAG